VRFGRKLGAESSANPTVLIPFLENPLPYSRHRDSRFLRHKLSPNVHNGWLSPICLYTVRHLRFFSKTYPLADCRYTQCQLASPMFDSVLRQLGAKKRWGVRCRDVDSMRLPGSRIPTHLSSRGNIYISRSVSRHARHALTWDLHPI
jgi:hypothetical protein